MNQALKVIVVILAFVGIFLAGAVTGGVAMAFISKGHMLQVQHERQLEQVQHQMERQERQMEKQQSMQLVQVLRQQLQQQQQLLQQRPQSREAQRRLPAPAQFGPQLMQRFANQIRPPLTPDERATIGPLVNETAENLRRLRQETTHSTEVMLEHLQDQISAVLTPAQRDRFGDMIQHWRDAFQKYNADQQQRQGQQRLLEQQMQQRRQQQLQQQAPAGSPPPAAAPAPASAPTSAPPPPPPAAPAG